MFHFWNAYAERNQRSARRIAHTGRQQSLDFFNVHINRLHPGPAGAQQKVGFEQPDEALLQKSKHKTCGINGMDETTNGCTIFLYFASQVRQHIQMTARCQQNNLVGVLNGQGASQGSRRQAIDVSRHARIAGTIAGENTVLLVAREPFTGAEVAEELNRRRLEGAA